MTPNAVILMAEYNRWMNERMFEAAATLADAELEADKGAYFGSILGTLNHIAVADTIWLHRFSQYTTPFPALAALSEFPHPPTLRHAISSTLAGLHEHRQRLDALILRWAAELRAEQLEDDLTCRNMAGVASSRNFGALVQHFFNHQTHHRGQVSTLLFQSGVDVGVTDLAAIIPA